jgi:aspartyl-tRNA(Asn)/glutamyl-tRNA(Gln) amidotransferase subunit B
VESAIEYEIERQKHVLESGGTVSQETRGWDEVKLKTFVQRTKETAKDYRYFPDPDLPKVNVPTHAYFDEARLTEIMPELPSVKRVKYEYIGLPSKQIEQIISTKVLDYYFNFLFNHFGTNIEALKLSANYLTSDFLFELGTKEGFLPHITPAHFAELMGMVNDKSINSRVTKDLLKELIFNDASPKDVAKEKGLLQSSDSSDLLPLVEEVIAENQSVVAEYLSGKEASIQFLVGQGMKKSRGTANPAVLLELFKSTIK